ncbi:hypothetical protein B7463_g4425, partial [Scytalidium lignicola]
MEEMSPDMQPLQQPTSGMPPAPIDIASFGPVSSISNFLHEFHSNGILFDGNDIRGYPNADFTANTLSISHGHNVRPSPYRSTTVAKGFSSLDVESLGFTLTSWPDTFIGSLDTNFHDYYNLQSALKHEIETSQTDCARSNYQQDSMQSMSTNIKYSTSATNNSEITAPHRTPRKNMSIEPLQKQAPLASTKPKRKLVCKPRKRIKGDHNMPSNIRVQKQSQRQCPREGCGRKFQRQEHLTRHMKIHFDTDAYSCLFCPKIFGRADNLKSHIKLHSFPNKKFSRTSYHPEAARVWAMMGQKSMTRKLMGSRESQVEERAWNNLWREFSG